MMLDLVVSCAYVRSHVLNPGEYVRILPPRPSRSLRTMLVQRRSTPSIRQTQEWTQLALRPVPREHDHECSELFSHFWGFQNELGAGTDEGS